MGFCRIQGFCRGFRVWSLVLTADAHFLCIHSHAIDALVARPMVLDTAPMSLRRRLCKCSSCT